MSRDKHEFEIAKDMLHHFYSKMSVLHKGFAFLVLSVMVI